MGVADAGADGHGDCHARAATTVSEGYKIEMPRILTLEAVLPM